MKAHIGTISTAVGGGLTLVGGFATEAAKKISTANADLEAAVSATGKSMEDYKEQIDKADKTGQHFGHTSDDTNEALAKLTRVTGDAGKALGDMHLVTEVAAAKHISLADAADLVGKMHMGAGKAFKQFGVILDAGKEQTKELAAAEKALASDSSALEKAKQHLADVTAVYNSHTTHSVSENLSLKHAQEAVGEASAKVTAAQERLKGAHDAAATASGGLDKAMAEVQKRLGETAENQANTFHGKISMIESKIKDATAAFGEKFGPALTGIGMGMAGLGPIIGGVGTLIGKFSTTTEAATAATEGLVVAEDAEAVSSGLALGPILLIVAAIAAVGVAIYELWTHWSTIWGWIKGVIGGVWDWIKDHWPLLLGILTGPIGLAVAEIIRHWDAIVGFVKGMPSRIAGAAAGMWDGIREAFKAAVNAIVDFWNGLHFHIPGFSVGPVKVGDFDLGVPHIPRMATGGITTSEGLAWLHPAEVVAPLSQFSTTMGGSMTWNGNIVVQGADDPSATAAAVRAEILRMTRSNVNAGLS